MISSDTVKKTIRITLGFVRMRVEAMECDDIDFSEAKGWQMCKEQVLKILKESKLTLSKDKQ